MADLCRKNQHFWSRDLNYPRFFALFLDLLGHVLEILSRTLQKRGARSNLVVGGSLDVIESTSFPSPTGLQRAHQTPGDPPDPPPGGLKIFFFQKKVGDAQAGCNLLAVPRGRFAPAGDGSPSLTAVLIAIHCIHFFDHYGRRNF